MKIVTTLRILMNKEFRPALKKVMEKWPDPKDTYIFVKLARIVEAEMKSYVDSLNELKDKLGYTLPDGENKSVTATEITDALLVKHGKFGQDGRPSLTGVPDAERTEFFAQKTIADKCISAYEDAVEKLLDDNFELEIPRQIKIAEKHLRKEVISAQDCFVLEPVLDLSAVMDEEDTKKDSTVEKE